MIGSYYIFNKEPLIEMYLPTLYTYSQEYDIDDIICLNSNSHYTILTQGEISTIVYNNDEKSFNVKQIKSILQAYNAGCGLIWIWDQEGLASVRQSMIITWFGIPGYNYDINPNNILPPLSKVLNDYNNISRNDNGVHLNNDFDLYSNWNPDLYDWNVGEMPQLKYNKIIDNI